MGKYLGKYEEKKTKRFPLLWFVLVLFVLGLTGSSMFFFLKENDKKPDFVQVDQKILAETVTVLKQTEKTETETHPEVLSLPKLHLNGDISRMWEKSDERIVAFVYEDGTTNTEGYVKIKIQGTSSIGFEKKNYTINMYQDQTCTEKLKMDLGWGAESKYCLKANWIDKTHARNVVTARIASQVHSKYNVLLDTPNHGVINGFPVEIYNNNEFLGLYTWNIPKDAWLLNINEDNPDHIVLCGEHTDLNTFFIGEPDYISWKVEVGKDDEQTLEKLNRLYDFIKSSTDEEFKEHIHEYLNLDALMNYYLMADIAFLRDNFGKNMLLFTYDSEIWYLGLYDLDTSWGTYFDGKSLYNYEEEPLGIFMNNLFGRLENCFGEQLNERYLELREELFTKEHILDEFNAFRSTIPDEVFEREQLRWGTEIPGYDYDQIEEYLDYIIPILDKKYADWDGWISYRDGWLLENIKAFEEQESMEETNLDISSEE